jgi:uncharacterized membrane protein
VTQAAHPPRLPALDVARGGALAAMALYHLGWDLSFYRLIATDVGLDPRWQWVARIIAGTFLTLVGVGLTLAHGERVRWRAFFRRLALVSGAALLITAATYAAFPGSYIFFGILHCIALSSVLALPFLRVPSGVVLAAAGLSFFAPWVLTQPLFDTPPLEFLGLGQRTPPANDYVPIFPWFALVLLGFVLGRALKRRSSEASWLRRPADRPLTKPLAWIGRHSLAFYLIHQPILLALLYPVAQALAPNPAAEAAPFLRAHEHGCMQAGTPAEVCRMAGACLVERLRADALWADVLNDRLRPTDRQRVFDLSRECFEDAGTRRRPGSQPP